jgi:hypothetical protein
MGGDQGGQVWIDDVSVVGPAAAAPVSELGTGADNVLNIDEVIDFNSTIADYGLTDFGGNASQLTADPTDASNTVLWITKNADQPWAGTTIAKGNVVYPLTATELGMSVRVWSPTAGITVRLKIEESTNGDNFIEADVVTTVAEDWETLVFDFGSPADGEFSADHVYDTLSIFMNFNVVGTGESYYVDDIKFIGVITVPPPAAGSELVTNGSFASGVEGWTGAAAVADNVASYFAANVASAGDPWSVNLSQVMTLEPGVDYEVTFSARASQDRTMLVGLGFNHSPWAANTEEVSLTAEWTDFTYTINTTDDGDQGPFGDDDSRVLFDMGADVGEVHIDNVSVKLTDGDGTELLTNGSFASGVEGWSGGAAVADNIVSYFAVVETTSANVYDVNLSQVMALTADTEYTVTFKAKSSIARTMMAGLGLNEGPWTNVAETVDLTTDWQEFTLVQTTNFGSDNSRVLFDMGGDQGGQVWIDDVSVK